MTKYSASVTSGLDDTVDLGVHDRIGQAISACYEEISAQVHAAHGKLVLSMTLVSIGLPDNKGWTLALIDEDLQMQGQVREID